MRKQIGLAALAFALATTALAIPVRADGHVFRGTAVWVSNPPEGSCGPFSTILVQTTQADVSLIEFVYQFGDSCQGTFHQASARGPVTVKGNLHRLTITGDLPLDDGSGRTVTFDVKLTRSEDFDDNDKSDRTVSATAVGPVSIDDADITGGASTSSATISRTKS